MTGFDPVALRDATPGMRHARHFNAAGSALPSAAVLETVVAHLRLEATIGGYEAAEVARERHEEVYALAARLVGGAAEDIALTESATVAWHAAMDAIPFVPGDRILASASSYVSSAIHLFRLRETHGVIVQVLPCAPDGTVDLEALDKALRTPARLVTIAHVPTSSGLVEPVAEVAALANAAGVPLLLDAVQSLGQLPVDLAALGVDLAVGTGRKFLRGPRGTGLLYASPRIRELLRPARPDVRGAVWSSADGYEVKDGARRFETWETAHALRLGFGTALREALDLGVDAIHSYTSGLAGRLRDALATMPGVTLTDPAAAGGAIVTFVVKGEKPADTVRRLRTAGVHVTSIPDHHGQWDLGRRGLESVVRASVHVYNDESDISALTAALGKSVPALLPARGRADVIVVGAGVHGSATTWNLARRGVNVIQLDRFADGHHEGSSHGHIRMIRRAYPNPIWDDLVDRAYLAWSELSEAAGETLLTTTGGLYARPAADGTPGLRGPGCETVDAARAAEIFPGLRLGAEFTAVHDPAAGVLNAAATMRSLRSLSVAAGADRRTGVTVLGWEPDGDGVAVRTGDGVLRADRLVIAAGPWTGSLVPSLAELLRVVRIVNIHVGASDVPAVSAPALGPFSIEVPGVGLLYGLPAFGGDAMKIGLDHGPDDDPARPQTPVTAAEAAELLALARRFLPAADGDVVDSVSCRYTMAPRNRFAVGSLPATPQVLVAAACSGHGFKFGPALGAALADLALGKQRPELDFLAPGALGGAT
ncbi:selenocysteine lyase/cysteine desulfurase/glycine/D-amino acid oxidase-like deaminating enzyme [Catenuloplanes nepalensis]|uniref:Selenocysteine lyase/cysteine desulfurase/glycine/D-amino acid oxidase-like deaminating enzyme n=1 Tax=Catenuloplanes nepalensis TaxID=587533 RepID=A0ABT9MLC5_9ACTN|nr:N-methyl-L-tryptophan oxidase [Catenuloplanes nepalensis]MDP9792221.1 selenocysteine lyase/cysteine desulfurase/glycine/D-amino acid oxidase-like deaminating enzyme [Catenuloplanes nepalensis]